MKQIQGKSILVQVDADFELSRVQVIDSLPEVVPRHRLFSFEDASA